MSFVAVGGVSKWSQVQIDADKNMLTFGLENLKELCLAMQPGDIIAFDQATGRMAAVHAGVMGTELLTKGTTFPPVWGFPDSLDAGTTIIVPLAAVANDSEGSGAVFNNASAQLRSGNNGGSVLNSAMRFTGINLPADAIIYNAFIGFTCNSARAAQTVTSRLWGERSAAPAAYGAAEDFTLRTRTLAFQSWTPAASWSLDVQYASGSLITIIQELVNAFGAYVNGTMAFQWLNLGTAATNYQSAYSYDANPLKAPYLVINYGVI